MKSFLLPLAFAGLAGPALALSCLPPDVARSFNEAQASEKVYVVVHGRLTFDAALLPEVDLARQDQTPPQTDIPAQLSGRSLSAAGFETAFDQPVTLRALCFGPWCGMPVSGTEYLAFLEKSGSGYTLAVSPCGGFDFAQPGPEMLETVKQCFNGGACNAATR